MRLFAKPGSFIVKPIYFFSKIVFYLAKPVLLIIIALNKVSNIPAFGKRPVKFFPC